MFSDDVIERAAEALDIRARLAGKNRLLVMEASAPPALPSGIAEAAEALLAVHRSIQDDDTMSDFEETLEDALKSGDEIAIGEGCEIYRAMLASRLRG